MDYRGFVLSASVMLSSLLALSSGCSAPDPGAITFKERGGLVGEPQGTSGGTSGSSGTPGPAPTTDGGGAAGTPDPIFGLTVMKWVDPGVQANAANAAHGGTVEGKDCGTATTCHGPGSAKIWLMGGTVYSAANGGTVVNKAEVRINDAQGNLYANAYTDNNGNFWFDATGKTMPTGAKVGVRREGGMTPRAMVTPLTAADAGCTANRANCHGTQAQGKVYVP